MSDPLVDRLRAAATEATRDLELDDPREHPRMAPEPRPRPKGRHRLTAAASLVAAALVVLVVWVSTGSPSEPDPPAEPVPEAPATAREAMAAAVAATRRAPAWTAEVTGGVVETLFVYQAPDRVETMVAGSGGGWETQAVNVGTDLWALDDGEWVLHQQDWRTSAPFNLVDGLTRVECAAWEDATLVYWFTPTGACGAAPGELPDDLPLTSEVGAVELDHGGRIRSIRAGEIPEVGGERVIRPDPGAADLLSRVGATGGATVDFRYEDVPPVTVPGNG